MISRALIKSTMGSLLGDLAELPPSAVRWADEAAGSVWTGSPALFLRLSPTSSQGIDEQIVRANGADEQTVTMVGQRRFTLSIRCESYEQDIGSPGHAANIADTIRIRLKRSSSIARWQGVCALETIQPTKRVGYKNQGRNVSAYVIDLNMLTVDRDIDTSIGSGDWIGEAVIDGNTLNDAAGPISPQPHIDVRSDS